MEARDERTAAILKEFAEGRIPSGIPADGPYSAELTRLSSYLSEIQRFALALGDGDLSAEIEGHGGALAESFRMLQSALRRITWQSKQVAAGDFSQRIDFMGEFSSAFNSLVQNLMDTREELLHIGNHDSLTGLYNRGFFDAEFDRISRGRAFPVSFIVADLIGLKAANERRGNAFGDDLIARAGQLLRGNVRGDDVLARIGGDEFAIILPGADAAAAEMVVSRIRASIGKSNAEGDPLTVGLSIGSGTAPTPERMADAFKEADDRMYLDKAAHYLK